MKKMLNLDNAIFFILAVSLAAAVYSALNHSNYNSVNEADVVISKLTDDGAISLLRENEVDEKKLEMLEHMSYSKVKEMLGVKKDFCVYFEDENGDLIRIGPNNGIGSDKIYINGEPCG